MRAHTVILGAGATIAAIPNGDKYGKKSSVMNGLIEKLHMSDILSGIGLKTQSDNLEDIYAELHSRPECKETVNQLEKHLYDYFAALVLPDSPTVYDFLVLSLTEKDVIATFNWDPLLLQAYIRCHRVTDNLPHIFCLHGNVAVGYCSEHKEFGTTDAECPICEKLLPPTKLLYPVSKKDYTSDEYIKGCWDATDYIIENSYMITIFGYSAPSSDYEAVRILKKAWGSLEKRQLEEVSVIDITKEEEMLEKWSHFIYTHHYRYSNNFFQSYLGMFPRRSCETVFATFQLNLAPDSNRGFQENMSWRDINNILNEVFDEEERTPHGENYPLHYLREGQFRN
jgi:hypothetical protein